MQDFVQPLAMLLPLTNKLMPMSSYGNHIASKLIIVAKPEEEL